MLSALLLVAAVMQQPNVLIVIIDDLGRDRSPWSGFGVDVPNMPNLLAFEALAARFPRCYTMPTCAPTRASLMTGLRPYVHGIGDSRDLPPPLDPKWRMISDLCPGETWAQGKWHLSPDPTHPLACRWRATDLTIENLDDYYNYEYYHDSINSPLSQTWYATDFFVRGVESEVWNPSPWLGLYASHAGHKPYHVPPLGSYTSPTDTDDGKWLASLEALDYYLGPVLKNMGSNTYVFLFGDNGSPNERDRVPQGQGKGSCGEGGICNTLLVAGPGVVAGDREQICSVMDILPTLDDLWHGVPSERSLLPTLKAPGSPATQRAIVSEGFEPDGTAVDAAAILGPWKLRLEQRVDGTWRETWHNLETAPPNEDGDPVPEISVPAAVRAQLEAELSMWG